VSLKKTVILRIVSLCAFLVASLGPLRAQLQHKVFTNASDTLVIDSLPISASKILVQSQGRRLVYGADYVLVRHYTAIALLNAQVYDTLHIQYQCYPAELFTTQRRYAMLYNSGTGAAVGAVSASELPASAAQSVQTDGVLLRGISFGNAQDLVLNSSLNLRMFGKVGKDIEIEGAVTDQEYPFQPEGTTTTLQDFDRIYVGMRMPGLSVLLGDHAANGSSASRFMKYAKKNRGLQLVGSDTLKAGLLSWEASAALARGRFSRNEIQGVEGLQGPYRLKGAREEQYVIVVSGTEVVYLDGKKLERGLQADYIIDYNLGEITFTPRNLINAFNRIVVEFQYSDRFYTRSVLATQSTLQRSKASYYLGVYSEQDAKNQPVQQDLEAVDSATGLNARQVLQGAGDNPSLAAISGVRRLLAFSNSEPNYVAVDTGAVLYYKHVELPDTHRVFYRITFGYTGPGKGHYVLTGTAANGKVYRYVGEVGGVPAGDHEPVIGIQAPSRLQMAEAGMTLTPRKGTQIRANIAGSAADKNLFSPLDDKDNKGYAAWLQVSDVRKLGKSDSSLWYLKNQIQAEQSSKYFQTVERYRDVEFSREWNRNLTNPENGANTAQSSYGNVETELGFANKFAITARLGALENAGKTAENAALSARYAWKFLRIQPLYMQSRGNLQGLDNRFDRKQIEVGAVFKQTRYSVIAREEKSIFNNVLGQIGEQSFGFSEWVTSVNRTTAIGDLQLEARRRRNRDVFDFTLKDAVVADNFGADWNTKTGKFGLLRLGTTYRRTQLLDTAFNTKYKDENHVALRLEYQFQKIAKALQGTIFYQSISGREQQRQYSYFEVPAGQGFYTWIDFNSNGIREVNEFQETPFKDQAKYVRLLIPTGTYIQAQATEFSGNVNYLPQKVLNGKYGRLTNRLSWNYTGKSKAAQWLNQLSPFLRSMDDASTLAANIFIRNLVEFEGRGNKLLLQWSAQKKGNRLFFTNGFDSRKSMLNQVMARWNANQFWQFRLSLDHKTSSYLSEYVPANNFKYSAVMAEPYVGWQPGNRFRIGLGGKYQNVASVVEIATLLEGNFQVNASLNKGNMLELKAGILQADYFLPLGTALAYDVLQGFGKGRNFRGTADLRFSANKNVQIVLSYEARKSADIKLIHVGRAEARYLF